MTNKKRILNITGIVLLMIIMIGVILGFSLVSGGQYFGFYSVLKILTYGATMFFLLSVLTNQKVKLAATSLIILFFAAGIVPGLQRVKNFLSVFLGKFKGQQIPEEILSKIQTPSGIIFVLQTLFVILLILTLIFSIYTIFNNKKYSSKEIIIMFVIIAVAFGAIETVENVYIFMGVIKRGLSLNVIIPRTPIMVFQYFMIVYLANNLRYSKEINLFYYIALFAYTFVIGIITMIYANVSGSDLIYTIFLISASILVYLYCTVLSFLIFKK